MVQFAHYYNLLMEYWLVDMIVYMIIELQACVQIEGHWKYPANSELLASHYSYFFQVEYIIGNSQLC